MEEKIKELMGIYQYRLGLVEGAFMSSSDIKAKLVAELQINTYKKVIEDLNQLLKKTS